MARKSTKALWREVQRHLGLADDGIPGRKTALAVRKGLKTKVPKGKSPKQKVPPVWLTQARKYVGLKEIQGPRHSKKILSWWEKIKAPFRDDETPWCAAFVGGVLEEVGIKSSRSAAARSYNSWGRKLDEPLYGCIVVFWRGSPSGWSGHVGFLEGFDSSGRVLCLGGNQSDAVNVRSFPVERVLSYRWPDNFDLIGRDVLASVTAPATSGNEV